MTTQSTAPKHDLRYVSIEPGRISLHGVSLTDGEYAVLRGIAERMKLRNFDLSQAFISRASTLGDEDWINEVPTC